jgi:asparagine synthase (glutamine-hydrolysing)
MPDIEHEIVPATEIPLHYSDIDGPAEPFDEPCLPIAERARLRAMLRRPCERDVRLYLTGFGGDELASGSSCHLHGLLWSHPRRAVTQTRAYRAMFRWSWSDSLRMITLNQSYQSWFRTSLARPYQQTLPNQTQPVEWGYPPTLPPWMHPDAVALVRDAVSTAADNAVPLAPDASQHYHLTCLRAGSRMVAQFEQIALSDGVVLAAPFYDDSVVEAFLSALPHERSSPWHYKPLLTTAMQGIVPPDNLARVTKGGSPVHEITGRRTHWRVLSSLWEDSWLARLGLIDEARLRKALSQSHRLDDLQGAFHRTLSAELWLRDTATQRSLS